jgi:hypothetical protein
MRKVSLFISIILAIVGAIFLIEGASTPFYGIINIAFCLLALEFIFIKKYNKYEPFILAILTLAISITSFFSMNFTPKDVDRYVIGILGGLMNYASGCVAIIYYSTYAQDYLKKRLEMISSIIGMIFIVVTLFALYFNKLADQTVYLIPAFSVYLPIIILDSLKMPSKYFKLSHILLLVYYLVVAIVLGINLTFYSPLFAFSILIIINSVINLVSDNNSL